MTDAEKQDASFSSAELGGLNQEEAAPRPQAEADAAEPGVPGGVASEMISRAQIVTEVPSRTEAGTTEPRAHELQPRRLKVAINRALIDKNETGDTMLFAEGWENVELSVGELEEVVKSGAAYCPQLSGRRNQKNFLMADVVSVDVDNGMNVEEALVNPIVRDHAAFLYTTVNHTSEQNRFRIVFPLPQTIDDPEEVRAIQRSLALRLGGDPSVTDPTRLFYGNRNAEIIRIGRTLSPNLVQDLIEQSRNFDASSWGKKPGAYRSLLLLNVTDPIKTSSGAVVPFGELPRRTVVHCPYHHDEHPSAFVTESTTGGRGIHCSKCSATYWPNRLLAVADDFEVAARKSLEERGSHLRAFDGVTVSIDPQYPAPGRLTTRLTLVRSPKGSGKTTALTTYFGRGDKVLLVGHRRLLNLQVSARLGLHSYLDRRKYRWQGARDSRLNRFAVSVDSIELVPPTMNYDLVILDESEQVLRHFLSDTIDSVERETLFTNFVNLLRRAEKVVALDADLGWITLYTLQQAIFGLESLTAAEPVTRFFEPSETTLEAFFGDPSALTARNETRLFIHDRKPGIGKTIEVYESERHLDGELLACAALGKRCFVASNSKGKVERIAEGLRKQLPHLRILLATGDTNQDEDVKAFIAEPAKRALDYDVILASPTMGTGVDITFSEQAKLIDVVFGFAYADITTHLDFDQQLGRVRHPGETKVWLSKRRLNYETSLDVVQRDILGSTLLGHRILGYTPEGLPIYRSGDLFLEMAMLIRSEERASINRLRDKFIAHKVQQGYSLVDVLDDDEMAQSGKHLMALGRAAVAEGRSALLLAATPLRRREFEESTEAYRAGRPQTRNQLAAIDRTWIELFYRARISSELVAADDGGRRRRQIRLLSAVVPELLRQHRDPMATFALAERDAFVRDADRRVRAIALLLSATPVVNKGMFTTGPEVTTRDLEPFVELLMRHKAEFESLLGIEIPRDVRRKPVQMLGRVLKQVGLRLKVRATKFKGQKIRHYTLDADGWETARALIELRASTPAWDKMREIHGWTEEDVVDEYDDEFFVSRRGGQDDL